MRHWQAATSSSSLDQKSFSIVLICHSTVRVLLKRGISARSRVFLPGEYRFAMATAGQLSGNLAWRKECGRGSLRAFGQFATHNGALVRDQNSIAPGIIIEKVHIDQPANLDL